MPVTAASPGAAVGWANRRAEDEPPNRFDERTTSLEPEPRGDFDFETPAGPELIAARWARAERLALARQPSSAPQSASGDLGGGPRVVDPCPADGSPGAISDYEYDIRDGKVPRPTGVVLDPDTDEIVG